MEKIREGTSCTFDEIEKLLQEDERSLSLIVLNVEHNKKAIMHIFWGNFCGDWLSGDGVLFYEDREVHSANDEDEFLILRIIELNKDYRLESDNIFN